MALYFWDFQFENEKGPIENRVIVTLPDKREMEWAIMSCQRP